MTRGGALQHQVLVVVHGFSWKLGVVCQVECDFWMHALCRPNPAATSAFLAGAIQLFQQLADLIPIPMALVEASRHADLVGDSGPPDCVVLLVVFGDIPSEAHVHIIVVGITDDPHVNAMFELLEEICKPIVAIGGGVWFLCVPPSRWWIDGKLAGCGSVLSNKSKDKRLSTCEFSKTLRTCAEQF